jgi:hypothetical protein
MLLEFKRIFLLSFPLLVIEIVSGEFRSELRYISRGHIKPSGRRVTVKSEFLATVTVRICRLSYDSVQSGGNLPTFRKINYCLHFQRALR